VSNGRAKLEYFNRIDKHFSRKSGATQKILVFSTPTDVFFLCLACLEEQKDYTFQLYWVQINIKKLLLLLIQHIYNSITGTIKRYIILIINVHRKIKKKRQRLAQVQ
jgi:hypothetical protein